MSLKIVALAFVLFAVVPAAIAAKDLPSSITEIAFYEANTAEGCSADVSEIISVALYGKQFFCPFEESRAPCNTTLPPVGDAAGVVIPDNFRYTGLCYNEADVPADRPPVLSEDEVVKYAEAGFYKGNCTNQESLYVRIFHSGNYTGCTPFHPFALQGISIPFEEVNSYEIDCLSETLMLYSDAACSTTLYKLSAGGVGGEMMASMPVAVANGTGLCFDLESEQFSFDVSVHVKCVEVEPTSTPTESSALGSVALCIYTALFAAIAPYLKF